MLLAATAPVTCVPLPSLPAGVGGAQPSCVVVDPGGTGVQSVDVQVVGGHWLLAVVAGAVLVAILLGARRRRAGLSRLGPARPAGCAGAGASVAVGGLLVVIGASLLAAWGTTHDTRVCDPQLVACAQLGTAGLLVAGIVVTALGGLLLLAALWLTGRARSGAPPWAGPPERPFLLSPDHASWWDGHGWRRVADQLPPGAVRSPDGNAWWDGAGWQPLGGPPPAGAP